MKEHWGGTVEPSGSAPEEITVESLLRELDADASSDEATVRPTELLEDALVSLDADAEGFRFDEDIVKHSLDELLLVLIAARADGTHGKQLMDDLDQRFDARLSPGTVYPRLHDMDAEGTVAVREMVRTKEYTISDDAEAEARVREAMLQHLAIGRFLERALADGDLF
ncbi:transcriptional regulator [Halarchaeum grantii]|uniref:Transcriptional regulator n=1 Tax=Halarchaeum grantii TaxID=1193105 RepID=A0A830ERG4_9EURY|nr:helix-turn-helix transcriptional regulator [Halarchaeum grantii]GGL22774.1 transcriptional regulator [Halarchaeum grantii]